mgnify:CR=1 FL=1|tara:strand:+ start:391 stop:786 length:396 start_codon:yes stop_codon:yes gene_type:complete
MSTLSVATVSSCTTVKSASTSTVPVFQNSSGTANGFLIRGWADFDGSSSSPLEASGNCSSFTDNGEGDYTFNFAVAMPDTNYVMLMGSSNGTAKPRFHCEHTKSTGSYRFEHRSELNTKQDGQHGQIAFVR